MRQKQQPQTKLITQKKMKRVTTYAMCGRKMFDNFEPMCQEVKDGHSDDSIDKAWDVHLRQVIISNQANNAAEQSMKENRVNKKLEPMIKISG
jgi:hypothetical protein